MICSKILLLGFFFFVVYIKFLFGSSSSDESRDLKQNTTSSRIESVSQPVSFLSHLIQKCFKPHILCQFHSHIISVLSHNFRPSSVSVMFQISGRWLSYQNMDCCKVHWVRRLGQIERFFNSWMSRTLNHRVDDVDSRHRYQLSLGMEFVMPKTTAPNVQLFKN